MKTWGICRNDPCPCGSGKKFKHCCLGKENGTASRHNSAGISEALRKALEGRQFKSPEEAQAFLDQITQQQNRRHLDEFHGLSPEQMHQILNFPFASPGLVRFPELLDANPRRAGTDPVQATDGRHRRAGPQTDRQGQPAAQFLPRGRTDLP